MPRKHWRESEEEFSKLSKTQLIQKCIGHEELLDRARGEIKRLRESRTTTYESGQFERTKIRQGKKRKQRTVKIPKRESKVVLYKIGRLQLFAYPYDNRNKLFIGYGKFAHPIDKYSVHRILVLYNIAKWFLSKGFKLSMQGKSRSSLGKPIQRAFKKGLEGK